jgi:hypothetical protein
MDSMGGDEELGRSYGKVVSEAAGAALGIANGIADLGPREISMWLLSEMPSLEKLTKELAAGRCPAEAADAHERLVAGLRAFADDLMAISEEASLEASQQDVYQGGLLTPSIAITGGGGRMRWELANSHGLAAIRQALADLRAAGLTENGVG